MATKSAAWKLHAQSPHSLRDVNNMLSKEQRRGMPATLHVQTMKERDAQYAAFRRAAASVFPSHTDDSLALSERAASWPLARLAFDVDLSVTFAASGVRDTAKNRKLLREQIIEQIPGLYTELTRILYYLFWAPHWTALAAVPSKVSNTESALHFGVHLYYLGLLLPTDGEFRRHLCRLLLKGMERSEFRWKLSLTSTPIEMAHGIDWKVTRQAYLAVLGSRDRRQFDRTYFVVGELNVEDDAAGHIDGEWSDERVHWTPVADVSSSVGHEALPLERNFAAWKNTTRLPNEFQHLSSWSIFPNETQMHGFERALIYNERTHLPEFRSEAIAALFPQCDSRERHHNATLLDKALRRHFATQLNGGTMRAHTCINYHNGAVLAYTNDEKDVHVTFRVIFDPKTLSFLALARVNNERHCSLVGLVKVRQLDVVLAHASASLSGVSTQQWRIDTREQRTLHNIWTVPASLHVMRSGNMVQWHKVAGDNGKRRSVATLVRGAERFELSARAAAHLALECAGVKDNSRIEKLLDEKVHIKYLDEQCHDAANDNRFVPLDRLQEMLAEEAPTMRIVPQHRAASGTNALQERPLTILVLGGAPGTGKTRLAQTALIAYLNEHVHAKAVCLSPSCALVDASFTALSRAEGQSAHIVHAKYEPGESDAERRRKISECTVLHCTTHSVHKYIACGFTPNAVSLDEHASFFQGIGAAYQEKTVYDVLGALGQLCAAADTIFTLDADADMLGSVYLCTYLLAKRAEQTSSFAAMRTVHVAVANNTAFNAVAQQRRTAFFYRYEHLLYERIGTLVGRHKKRVAIFIASQRERDVYIAKVRSQCATARVLVVEGKQHGRGGAAECGRQYKQSDGVYYRNDYLANYTLYELMVHYKIDVLMYTTAMSHGVSISERDFIDEVFVMCERMLPQRWKLDNPTLWRQHSLQAEDFRQAIERVRHFARLNVLLHPMAFGKASAVAPPTKAYIGVVQACDRDTPKPLSIRKIVRQVEVIRAGGALLDDRLYDKDALVAGLHKLEAFRPPVLSLLLDYTKRVGFVAEPRDVLATLLVENGYEVERDVAPPAELDALSELERKFKSAFSDTTAQVRQRDAIAQCLRVGLRNDSEEFLHRFSLGVERRSELNGSAKLCLRGAMVLCLQDRIVHGSMELLYALEVLVTTFQRQDATCVDCTAALREHAAYAKKLTIRDAVDCQWQPVTVADIIFHLLRMCAHPDGPFQLSEDALYLSSKHVSTYMAKPWEKSRLYPTAPFAPDSARDDNTTSTALEYLHKVVELVCTQSPKHRHHRRKWSEQLAILSRRSPNWRSILLQLVYEIVRSLLPRALHFVLSPSSSKRRKESKTVTESKRSFRMHLALFALWRRAKAAREQESGAEPPERTELLAWIEEHTGVDRELRNFEGAVFRVSVDYDAVDLDSMIDIVLDTIQESAFNIDDDDECTLASVLFPPDADDTKTNVKRVAAHDAVANNAKRRRLG